MTETTHISAELIEDSISNRGIRLSTVAVTFHRFILAEWNTHRAFSRNSASSRAIPVAKQLERVELDPAMPIDYRYNQPGMQAVEPMTAEDRAKAEEIILRMRDACVEGVRELSQLGPLDDKGNPLGLHKQWANRYIEPWMWHTVVCTSVDWDNFFKQRMSHLAQPEIEAAAEAVYEVLSDETAPPPPILNPGEWHTPFVLPEEREELDLETRKKVSVARCARVSYLTHDGVRDIVKDLQLYERLVTADPPHWSPLEHVATPDATKRRHIGNLPGWVQLRHWEA